MPGPLRLIGDYILGHPNAHKRPRDDLKIRLGNDTVKVTARIVAACLRARVPCALENPNSSRLFRAPLIARLARRGRTSVCDFCQYGALWRKRTKILVWSFKKTKGISRRCVSKGVCSRAGLKRVVLQGPTREGVCRTALACAYPEDFAKAAAQMLVTSAAGQ